MASTSSSPSRPVYDSSKGVRYGLPFFLEDKTGRLGGSEFNDLHDRMRLVYRRTRYNSQVHEYEVYDLGAETYEPLLSPEILLRFNPDHTLGTIIIEKDTEGQKMETFLYRVSEEGG